ncbi:hypothetical protein M2271_002014 [Streptomyces sp. LBL]|uniref:hypothetical protein n=1 Tax=Streptomyces sp. LBL TaxID=2940562 RepID=UPI002473BF54|nr:hypothetical protein [Streptomyces sp. LBL]MDH6624217.1 hypothetical protein [Streptomyces sp. LBL]
MSFGPPPSVYTQSTLAADQQRRKRRRALFGALAAVLAVVVSAGAWLLWDRDPSSSDKPATAAPSRLDVRQTVEKQPGNTSGAMAFRFSLDDMSPGERRAMPGMWATDRILAKGINRTLVGFRIGSDASPGDEEWKLQFSGPICGYTRHTTVENRTAACSGRATTTAVPATTWPSSTSTTAGRSGSTRSHRAAVPLRA